MMDTLDLLHIIITKFGDRQAGEWWNALYSLPKLNNSLTPPTVSNEQLRP